MKFVFGQYVVKGDLIVCGKLGEGKVDMCVLGWVELCGVLVKTGAVEVVSFEVGNAPEDGRRATTNNCGAAVGYAAVGARLGSPRRTSAGVGTEDGCGPTLEEFHVSNLQPVSWKTQAEWVRKWCFTPERRSG